MNGILNLGIEEISASVKENEYRHVLVVYTIMLNF